jgi:hypothetical protein
VETFRSETFGREDVLYVHNIKDAKGKIHVYLDNFTADFRVSKLLWRQGCGKYLFPHQSPLSAAEFPRHSWRQRLGRIGREAQHAYIIINSLQTDM